MSPALNQYTLHIEQHLYFQIYLYVIFHIKFIFHTFAAPKDMNCGNYCILSHIFKWVYLAIPGARVGRLGVQGASLLTKKQSLKSFPPKSVRDG